MLAGGRAPRAWQLLEAAAVLQGVSITRLCEASRKLHRISGTMGEMNCTADISCVAPPLSGDASKELGRGLHDPESVAQMAPGTTTTESARLRLPRLTSLFLCTWEFLHKFMKRGPSLTTNMLKACNTFVAFLVAPTDQPIYRAH